MYDMKPYLKEIDKIIEQGPYKDTWESLAEYPVPQWYQKAKFGIFLHWGVFSVPAFRSEWYPRNMYMEGSSEYLHHLETYGPHKKFGYKDFIPMFKAEKFAPESWVELFKTAGAEYIMPVAEHHDGFQMYDSEISEFNSCKMGPKRNVLGELKTQTEKEQLFFGASSHRLEHWFFLGNGRKFDSDIKGEYKRGDLYWPSAMEADHFDIFSEPVPTKEYLEDWLVRTCEIIDKYHPQILYFDWWIQHFSVKPYLRKLTAYYYNRAEQWGKKVVINYKYEAYPFGVAVPDVERGQFAEVQPYIWQTDTAIALNSWCYTENNKFRGADEIICDLVDIVSKNGRLLLNVGPKSDGTICPEETVILMEIGDWMKINGEAIYGTRPWRKYGEGPTKIEEGEFKDFIKKNFTSEDFRFTCKGGILYATALKCSKNGEYCVRSLAAYNSEQKTGFNGILQKISVLGSGIKPEWKQKEDGLYLKTEFVSDKPIVFCIKID